ncbi:trypsin-like serine protease [Photobacterium lipolyticum]|uniref:GlyGly-CTERM sorting domain-containing protein n=1 Tax=Photobacterium lipolyticum TaxID=266810 RepID=A0A2T3MZW6_9GAMM|nr:trypsin-like serine protease [Photobacterium lipolyticum]PSW05514.1 GlyGly-CTERM sorting domain-containing protein [Photobacterium lipolyticum]
MNKKNALTTILIAMTLSPAIAQETEQSLATPQAKILNGDNASAYANDLLPWQASILMKSSDVSGCGAVVISNYWIVTAAHCIDPSISNTLIAGTSYIPQGNAKTIDSKYIFNIIETEKYRHPLYNGHNVLSELDNDVAVMKVDRPLYTVAKPIKIATPAEQALADDEFATTWVYGAYSKPTLIASGWGDTTETYLPPNELQVVKLAGIPDSQCATSYTSAGDQYFVCADSNTPSVKKDACSGDSGGPLIWQNPTHKSDSDKGLRVVGVTSNGPDCYWKNSGVSDAQFNGLYTQLSTYLSWIESTTGVDLTSQAAASFSQDPFELINDEPKKTTVASTENNSETEINPNTGSSSGGSVPLLGLISLAAVGLMRRRK